MNKNQARSRSRLQERDPLAHRSCHQSWVWMFSCTLLSSFPMSNQSEARTGFWSVIIRTVVMHMAMQVCIFDWGDMEEVIGAVRYRHNFTYALTWFILSLQYLEFWWDLVIITPERRDSAQKNRLRTAMHLHDINGIDSATALLRLNAMQTTAYFCPLTYALTITIHEDVNLQVRRPQFDHLSLPLFQWFESTRRAFIFSLLTVYLCP